MKTRGKSSEPNDRSVAERDDDTEEPATVDARIRRRHREVLRAGDFSEADLERIAATREFGYVPMGHFGMRRSCRYARRSPSRAISGACLGSRTMPDAARSSTCSR